MNDLEDWLRAQLDSEQIIAEQVAALAQEYDDTDYEPAADWYANESGTSGDQIIAMHPARALAEIAAKRALIELISEAGGLDHQVSQEFGSYSGPQIDDRMFVVLAQPYAGRPGWREEWRLSE